MAQRQDRGQRLAILEVEDADRKQHGQCRSNRFGSHWPLALPHHILISLSFRSLGVLGALGGMGGRGPRSPGEDATDHRRRRRHDRRCGQRDDQPDVRKSCSTDPELARSNRRNRMSPAEKRRHCLLLAPAPAVFISPFFDFSIGGYDHSSANALHQ